MVKLNKSHFFRNRSIFYSNIVKIAFRHLILIKPHLILIKPHAFTRLNGSSLSNKTVEEVLDNSLLKRRLGDFNLKK